MGMIYWGHIYPCDGKRCRVVVQWPSVTAKAVDRIIPEPYVLLKDYQDWDTIPFSKIAAPLQETPMWDAAKLPDAMLNATPSWWYASADAFIPSPAELTKVQGSGRIVGARIIDSDTDAVMEWKEIPDKEEAAVYVPELGRWIQPSTVSPLPADASEFQRNIHEIVEGWIARARSRLSAES